MPSRSQSMRQPITPPRYRSEGNENIETPPSQLWNEPVPSSRNNADATTPGYGYEVPIGSETSTSFSPSKARAQTRATHQLTILKTWLTDLLRLHDQAQVQADGGSRTENHQISERAWTSHEIHPLILRWEREYINIQQVPPTKHPAIAADTFKVLQDLMYANQAADSHRFILHEARQADVARYEMQNSEAAQGIAHHTGERKGTNSQYKHQHRDQARESLSDLHNALSQQAETSLASLVQIAVALGVDFSNAATGLEISPIEMISTAIIDRTSSIMDLRTIIASLESLKSALESQLQKAKTELDTLEEKQATSDQNSEILQAQTTQWQRESKQVMLKIQEYNDRVTILNRTRPGTAGNNSVLVEDVIELQDRVQRHRSVVETLEDKVHAFHGLPADLESSRQEVKRARNELAELKRRREELFGSMVD